MILIGHLIDQLGACTYSRAVADHDPRGVGWRVVHDDVHEPVELRSCATEVPVTDGHGGRALGRLRHVETGERGDVHIVADLFGSLPAGDHAGRLFLSAEGAVQGGMLELRAIAAHEQPGDDAASHPGHQRHARRARRREGAPRCATATRTPRRC